MRSYGKIELDAKGRTWRITTEPHVALRLKRIFPKIDTRDHGVMSISATPETSRDLEWFLERYPHDVAAAGVMAERASKHKEAETTVQKLLNGTQAPKAFNLKLPPRDYQVMAAQMWLTVKSLLLGDEVGLGKTFVAITGLVEPGMVPALVVTLTHLPLQWKREIERATDFEVHILKSAKPYDITKYHKGHFPDIVISNYHKLDGWARVLDDICKTVVLDEIHELRHSTSNKYAAAKHLADAAEFKLGLSATTIFNYGGEMYNVLDALRPDALGTREEFNREWCTREMRPKLKNPAAFGLYLREAGLMLRRTRMDVKRELKPVTVVPHTIEANPAVLKAMEGKAVDLARLVLKQNEDFKGQRMQAAGEFNIRMRQATGLAKAPFVAEFVKFLHEESGEKIVLFGWHREVYSIWMERLKHLKPVLYTGSESADQKEKSRLAFVEGDSQVMIISNRSGMGLDGLQNVCRTGVIGELDFSPAVHIQNTGRIHRDGQEEPVVMYYLIADSGSDPIISDILGVKRQQLEGINSPTPDQIELLQVEADYVKRLAQDFLRRRGEVVPEEEPVLA